MANNVLRLIEHSENNKLWSAKDAIVDFQNVLDALEEAGKKVQIAIHYQYDNPDGGRSVGYLLANLNRDEHIALITTAQYKLCRDMFKD